MSTPNKEFQMVELSPDDIPLASTGLDQPVFFADFIRGTIVSSGVVKLNFVELKLDAADESVKLSHSVTVVTPILQVRAWAKFLNKLADDHGIPPLPGEAGSSNGG